MDMPAHVKTMASIEVNYAAMMHVGFFTVALLGITEHPSDSDQHQGSGNVVKDVAQAALLPRFLTPVMKAQCLNKPSSVYKSVWKVLVVSDVSRISKSLTLRVCSAIVMF